MADQGQRSRSVYVGNLPWDVKEEDLRKIFSQVGTIVSLRMPLDPETGNSKGFAFCEFRDQDSTNVAIKHFNGFEMNGRKIRVDSAANNSDKDSKGRGAFATIEQQYGEPCDPVKAPEVIAERVGAMPPEQVHDIINQAKRCLQGDPQEARVALVNNPQLTYALLLALVRGRYISKERGTEALVKPEPALLPLFPESRPPLLPSGPAMMHMPSQPSLSAVAQQPMHSMGGHVPPAMPPMFGQPPVGPPLSQTRGPAPRQYANDAGPVPSRHYNDPPTNGSSHAPPMRQPFHEHQSSSHRPYERPDRPVGRKFNDPSGDRAAGRTFAEPPGHYGRQFNEAAPTRSRGNQDYPPPSRDRRGVGAERPARFESNVDRSPIQHSPVYQSPRTASTPPPAAVTASREEQEKAELIMQVLKLKEEDIVKMAPEQQATIRKLRDQFKSINK